MYTKKIDKIEDKTGEKRRREKKRTVGDRIGEETRGG